MATGRFRATGPQAAMAHLVSRLRRRHLSAGCDASLSARSFDASGRAEARCRRERSSLPAPTGVGGTRDDMRAAGHGHSDRGYGRLADWRPDHWPGIRRPDAARLRPRDRARVRRLHAPARLRIEGMKAHSLAASGRFKKKPRLFTLRNCAMRTCAGCLGRFPWRELAPRL